MRFSWLCLILLASLPACDPDPPPGPEPIFPEDFATSYAEVRNCRFSVEHDGVNIIVYASPDAAAAYRDGNYPFATGSIIVKREHRDSACTDITGYTAMKKIGTGTTASDWSWQRVAIDRSVDSEASRCVGCHTGCTEGRDLTCTDP